MNPIPRALIIVGAILIVAGLAWHLVGKAGIPLGRLPGDITIEKPGVSFYFPVTTSILVSIALSLILYLIRYFKSN